MKWITREKIKVDRVACPWLIKKFIDTDAEFLFLPRNTDWARINDGIVFDVPNCELGHHGEDVSFNSILKKYDLGDPALVLLGEIVRAADSHPANPHPAGEGSTLGCQWLRSARAHRPRNSRTRNLLFMTRCMPSANAKPTAEALYTPLAACSFSFVHIRGGLAGAPEHDLNKSIFTAESAYFFVDEKAVPRLRDLLGGLFWLFC